VGETASHGFVILHVSSRRVLEQAATETSLRSAVS